MNKHLLFNDTFVVPTYDDFHSICTYPNSYRKCITYDIGLKWKILFVFSGMYHTFNISDMFSVYINCTDFKFKQFICKSDTRFIIVFNLFNSNNFMTSYEIYWTKSFEDLYTSVGKNGIGKDLNINVVKDGGYMLNIELHCIGDDEDVEYLKQLFKVKE